MQASVCSILPGWEGAGSHDISHPQPDSSQLSSTSSAAQQGTHFISFKLIRLHIMIFTRDQACLLLTKGQEGKEGTLKVMESSHSK